MADAFPSLGFDPCPGDLAGYRALADYAHRSAATLEASLRTLSSSASPAAPGSPGWRGGAATAFRGHLERDMLPLVDQATGSVQRAASTLRTWVITLAALQDEARALERRARPYSEELAASRRLPAPGPAAAARADEARTVLAAIHMQADDLHARYLAAVSRTSGELQDATDMAPKAPALFAAVWQDVTGGWSLVTGEIGQFVHDRALLEFISGVCDAISTVAGLLALIPSPLSLVLAGIAVGAAGAEMATDSVLAGFDHGSWTAVALDGVAVVSDGTWIKATRQLTDIYRASDAEMASVWSPSGRKIAVAPSIFGAMGDATKETAGSGP
jgi:hypothetical protein